MADAGAGRRVPLAIIARAFVRRDLREAASYRSGIVVRTVSLAGTLISLALFARFVGLAPNPSLAPFGGDYLAYSLVGLAGTALALQICAALPRRLRQAQLQGTLEAILATPAPAVAIVLSTPLADALVALAQGIAVLGLGVLLLGPHFPRVDGSGIAGAVLVLGAALPALLSVGVAGGALTLLLRRSDPLSFATGLGTALVAGGAYPVSILPRALRFASLLLPGRYLIDGLHGTLLEGWRLGSLASIFEGLVLSTLAYGGVGALLLAWALCRGHRDGTLGQY